MEKRFLSLLCLFVVFSVCSCANPKNEFKNDSSYYIALRKLKSGNISEAKRHFLKASKKGSSYVRRRSAEELTKLGNIQERLEFCENLLKNFTDEDAILLVIKQYELADEYSKLLSLTENLDYSSCLNEIALIRLKSMFKVEDSRFLKDAQNWFCSRTLSQSHCELYDFLISKETSFYSDSSDFDNFLFLADFRVNIYRKKYKLSYEKFKENPEKIPFLPQFVSDIGKSCLYASTGFLKDAQNFDLILKQVSETPAEFYVAFYAARLYEKSGDYFTLAQNRYKKAMETAINPQNYDNALWYLLQLSLKRSVLQGVEAVKKYCKTWNNPSYFDDFFSTLSPLLLSEGKWNSFREIYKAVDGYASDEVVAKYAYIYGRLVQERLLPLQIDDTNKSEEITAFTRALTSGSDSYYRIMALNQLGIAGENAEEILTLANNFSDLETSTDAESLLLGYATFGLPEKIYPEWQTIYGSGKIRLSHENGIKIANFLKDCGNDDNRYFPQSLRIAAKVFAKTEGPISREDLKVLYPQNFSEIVSKTCAEYNVPEEIMYALIRSESFFDANINSFAGAIGLTQLMKDTANDISRKLKMPDYNLKNPEENITFGTFYLSELAKRLDGNWLLAFFSYNAGITRVRRWVKSSKIAFGNRTYLPDDLFLETIPYEETREYGRKLVSATALYGWIYYEKDIYEVVGEIVK